MKVVWVEPEGLGACSNIEASSCVYVVLLLLLWNCSRSTGLRRRVERLRGGAPSIEEATPSTDEEAPSAQERGEVGSKDGDVVISSFAESMIVEEGPCGEESLLVAFVSLVSEISLSRFK